MAEVKVENKNLEREYVIPLRSKYNHVARYKKTPKAIKTIKEFLVKHMRIYDRDLNKIKIDKSVNEFLWARGIKNPPHKVKVKVKKEGENVKVELVNLPNKLKFKKLREEKVSREAKEAIEKKKSLKDRVQETMKGGTKEEKSGEEKETKSEEKKEDSGVEKSKETQEKKEAVKEETQKMEKDLAKQQKHVAKAQSPKEQKNQRAGYNKSSRGR